jgi:two-component system, cell cycle sensor histidine kinase and response regulator CckA
MMHETITVLLVEDNPGDARLMREAVREAEGSHIHLVHVDTLGKALARLDQDRFDVVMLDLSLPDAEGLTTLVRTHAHAPSVPIVVLTGLDDEGLAVRAVREGAQDYLVKGQVTGQLLVRAMRYATERKRAIEALQRSEEYYRSLIENALDVITVLDAAGVVRYGSPSFERVLGYPQGALTGANALALLHPEDHTHFREMLDIGTNNPGAMQSFECRLLHRNGTWRVIEAIGKRFEQDTAVNGFVLNSRDITERKRAEEALRQANETLRAVIETSPLAIYAVDLDGQVKSWNSAAERIFGYTEAEVVNRLLPIIAPGDEEQFLKRLREAVSGNLLVGREERCHKKNGDPIDVSVWNAQLRDATGAVTGIVEAVADNSERKRLEEQMRQAQKMEAVGRLAGGIAHDFNNLLTVITGYCQMLIDRIPATDPTADDLHQVLKAADRATTLTKQLLAFSRRQIFQPKVIDLRALVAEMDPILKRLVGEKIQLVTVADPDLGRVRVDPGHLEQVIVNLAVNARDAMPLGGRLTITMKNTHVEPFSSQLHVNLQPGSYVLLEVSDTGVGIDDEARIHLFEPFFTTKEKGRGTGLGLSTSYGIVKQNRGEISVQSEVGVGTTFSIYLPLVNEEAEPAHAASARRSFRGAETVLVAEDEDGVRTVITEMLRKQGYSVVPAPGGEEALEIGRDLQTKFDLLISDVIMPGMNGPELAGKLRAVRPGLRVLYVSGYTDSAISREDELGPGTLFLHKPFTTEQLAEKVREILDQPDAGLSKGQSPIAELPDRHNARGG